MKITKYLLGLNYDRVQKTDIRLALQRVALLWIRTRKILAAHLWL